MVIFMPKIVGKNKLRNVQQSWGWSDETSRRLDRCEHHNVVSFRQDMGPQPEKGSATAKSNWLSLVGTASSMEPTNPATGRAKWSESCNLSDPEQPGEVCVCVCARNYKVSLTRNQYWLKLDSYTKRSGMFCLFVVFLPNLVWGAALASPALLKMIGSKGRWEHSCIILVTRKRDCH